MSLTKQSSPINNLDSWFLSFIFLSLLFFYQHLIVDMVEIDISIFGSKIDLQSLK